MPSRSAFKRESVDGAGPGASGRIHPEMPCPGPFGPSVRSRQKVKELEIRREIEFLCQRNLRFGEEELKRREDGRFEEMTSPDGAVLSSDAAMHVEGGMTVHEPDIAG